MSSKNVLEIFGGNVQKYRKEKKISQEKLADLANVHRTYVGMIERSEKKYYTSQYGKNCECVGG
jgi:transcriptional regulator with XRE-family HTH domain